MIRLIRIMTAVVICVIVIVGISFEGNACAAIIASSTFDSSDEGWITQDIDVPCILDTTYTPDYYASGGNPGGYISEQDPSTASFFFSAPAKFLGNMEFAYQGCLSFDWITIGGGTIIDAGADVVLIGAGKFIYIDTPPPGKTWSTQEVVLGIEDDWHKCNGDTVTEEDMRSVLASLDFLLIRGDHISAGVDYGALDNVILADCDDCPIPTEHTSWGKIKALYR